MRDKAKRGVDEFAADKVLRDIMQENMARRAELKKIQELNMSTTLAMRGLDALANSGSHLCFELERAMFNYKELKEARRPWVEALPLYASQEALLTEGTEHARRLGACFPAYCDVAALNRAVALQQQDGSWTVDTRLDRVRHSTGDEEEKEEKEEQRGDLSTLPPDCRATILCALFLRKYSYAPLRYRRAKEWLKLKQLKLKDYSGWVVKVGAKVPELLNVLRAPPNT